MDEYIIKKLVQENFNDLKPLMSNCFGMDVDFNYFKWKFLDNPSGQVEGYMAIHSASGGVAAYYGVIPEKYEFREKERVIYQSCDTMTHSSHRRKGLFKKLSAHCFEALRAKNELFIIGFSGPMSTPGFLKFGWIHLFDMHNMFIPRIPSLGIRNNEKGVHEIRDTKEIKELIEGSNHGSDVRSSRSLEIFNWRISNPRYDYRIIGQKVGGKYIAYACYYEDIGKLVLFDFNFSNLEAAKIIVKSLKRKVQYSKLKGIISFVQKGSISSKRLSEVGFLKNPFSRGPLCEKTPFIIYSTEEQMSEYGDKGRWAITAFDHDAM